MPTITTPETTTNARGTTRRELLVVLLAGVIALLLVSVLITRTSQAAFTARTANPSNDFLSGTMLLENNPGGGFGASTSAEFTEIGLVPGDTGTGCIDVKYSGSVTDAADLTNVVFYVTNLVDGDGSGTDTLAAAQLSDDLDLDISVNDGTCTSPGAPVASTSGTLASFDGGFTTGWDSTWQPASNGEVRAFEFTWTLGSDTLDDAQGDSAAFTLNWEINSQ